MGDVVNSTTSPIFNLWFKIINKNYLREEELLLWLPLLFRLLLLLREAELLLLLG
jgi:hypothetical protein